MAPSHYPNQCWNSVNWALRNKLQWNVNRNSYIFIQENPFENVVWKMAAILSWPQCVNCASSPGTNVVIHTPTWFHASFLFTWFCLSTATFSRLPEEEQIGQGIAGMLMVPGRHWGGNRKPFIFCRCQPGSGKTLSWYVILNSHVMQCTDVVTACHSKNL